MNQFCSVGSCKRLLSESPRVVFALGIISFLLLALCPARAADPEGEYLQIYEMIQQGDMLKKNGDIDKALAKYKEAQVALTKFQRGYPERNAKVITYRLNYVSTQIAALAPQASSSGNTADSTPGSKGSGSAGSTQVKLLEPGAEPRKPLRFHPKAGDKQSMVLTMKIAMGIKIGDMENPPMKLPPIKMAMDITIREVAANGDINYDIVMSEAGIEQDPEVIPQVAEAMKTALAGAKGLSGSGTISSRGVNKAINIKVPEGTDAQNQFVEQVKETMSNVVTPFPEEAVGAGAKWEIKAPRKTQGMTINQSEKYELVSSDGERIALKSTDTSTASSQKVPHPMVPGAKVDMSKMTSTGTGEVTFDLTQILPSEANVEFHQDMAMSTSEGGQKQTMSRKMDMNLHVESK